MFRKILVPLDGSALSERVLPVAEAIARRQGSRVLLVRAIEAHTPPGGDTAQAQRRLVEEAESYLAAHAGRLSLSPEGGAPEIAVYYGDPVHCILDEIKLRGADLVAISTHGRTGLRRLLLGSVADQIVHRASTPVLLVPAGCTPVVAADRPPHILVPLDGSDFAAEALEPVRQLAAGSGARVTLLSAIELLPSLLYAAGIDDQMRDVEPEIEAMRAYLDTTAEHLRDVAADVSVHVTIGPAAQAIAEYARDQQVDLVAMATHGRGGLARVVMGSVTTGVLHHVHTPLLVVRPSALRESVPQPKGELWDKELEFLAFSGRSG
jgi:nucleotide-binding universal stress UspA family protein